MGFDDANHQEPPDRAEYEAWEAKEALIRQRDEALTKLDAALLQLGEVTAHRDRLRDMLNDVRGMAFSVAFTSKEDLAARILRRIEDGIVEKPTGAEGVCPLCYHAYTDEAHKRCAAEKRKCERVVAVNTMGEVHCSRPTPCDLHG